MIPVPKEVRDWAQKARGRAEDPRENYRGRALERGRRGTESRGRVSGQEEGSGITEMGAGARPWRGGQEAQGRGGEAGAG